MQKMTPSEAFALWDRVVSNAQGTRADHNLLTAAGAVLYELVNPPEKAAGAGPGADAPPEMPGFHGPRHTQEPDPPTKPAETPEAGGS